MAKVFRNSRAAQPVQTESSADELKTGIEYVRALGDDGHSLASHIDPSPVPSFTSIESSHNGHDVGSASAANVPRMLARVGDRFRYRVSTTASRKSTGGLEVRLVSGKPLPKFMKVDMDAVPSGTGARLEKRVVEFFGTPAAGDVGAFDMGVYERVSGECVGRVVVEVVERKSG
ncbi:hypothetical protein ONZ51_g12328 [Trametes cubensis]|uniref:Uncharacterized protein n=1 Tax=Trametes cubensis TaxID=1111947 RepID=A0AAD7TIP4_9APHY|nr:hypothetical protein ONZ51_g12328 [Trametes cubensis]